MCAETYYFQQIVNINHVEYLNDSESANIKIKKIKNILNVSAHLHKICINKTSKYGKQVKLLKIDQKKNFSSCPGLMSQNAHQQNS